MTDTAITTRLPDPVLEALDRFRAEQAGNMSRAEAVAALVADALIGAGYLEAPPGDD